MMKNKIIKRIISLMICFVMLISCICVNVKAKEQEFYKVLMNAGDGCVAEKAIVEDDEIYIAASSFGKYTKFKFDKESYTFLIEGQDKDKAFKKVMINPDKKLIGVGQKVIDLKNCFKIDGNIFLPLSQMLPILNAAIIDIDKDSGEIRIANTDLSMAELLYDFDIEDYVYDINEEFFDNPWLAGFYYGPSYIFNTVTDKRFNRLDVIFKTGEIEDYKEVFSGYMKSNDLYLEAMAEKDTPAEILEGIGVFKEAGQVLYDAYDWIETLSEVPAADVDVDPLVAFVQDIMVDDAFDTYFDQMVKGAYSGELSLADAFDMIDYAYAYFNHAEDHELMLDAVFDFEQLVLKLDPMRMGANQVYQLYGDEVLLGMTNELLVEYEKILLEEVIEKTKYASVALYTTTAEVAGDLIEMVMPGDSKRMSLLPMHVNVISRAKSKAVVPTLETDESTNNYRLSLLLTLIASRECYSIMADQAKEYGEIDTYYSNRVEKLDDMIKGLYMVAENVRFDSYENYETFAEQNLEKIKDSEILENLSTYDEKDLYKDFYESNYKRSKTTEPLVIDVTKDGIKELIFVDKSKMESEGSLTGYVYTVQNGKVVNLETKKGATFHAGGFFAWYLCKKENQWCLAEEKFGMWQGRGEIEFIAYYLNNKGDRDICEKLILSSSDPKSSDGMGFVTDTAFYDYQKKLNDKLQKCEPIFITYSESSFIPVIDETVQYYLYDDAKIDVGQVKQNSNDNLRKSGITIEWDGKYEDSNELVELELDISQGYGDGTYWTLENESGKYYSEDGDLVATVTKKITDDKGIINIELTDAEGIYNIAVNDAGYDPGTDYNTEISSANATAVYYDNGESEFVSDTEYGLYRSYTGVWFWGICSVAEGELYDYDGSWIEYELY